MDIEVITVLKWSGESGKVLNERYLCVKRVKRTNFLEKYDQRALTFAGNIRKLRKELCA